MSPASDPQTQGGASPTTAVEQLVSVGGADLHDLCDAADAAIIDGGGFGWLSPPPRQVMETYWKGVLLVPERQLFVARLDGTICGSGQLWLPSRNNEAGARSAQLTTFFLAPWSRGHGLARRLVETIEAAARDREIRVLNLDVRETQEAAIGLYESLGYRRWGTNPHYAWVDGRWVAGHFYAKDLNGDPPETA
jgi:ribosomal protein S18 acetylase RimI-like enzyme